MGKNEMDMRPKWKKDETKRVAKTRQKHRHNNENNQDKTMKNQAEIIEQPAKYKQHHKPTQKKTSQHHRQNNEKGKAKQSTKA